MTNQEKYEMWRKIAQKMLKDQNIIQEVGVERAANEYGIKFTKTKPLRVREKIIQ